MAGGIGEIPWERACSRWHQRGLVVKPCCLHREQARSHKNAALSQWLNQSRWSSLIGSPGLWLSWAITSANILS
ncbi:MAG TPA: hypothetical protein DD669_03285 [Pseudomonas sp.]|nr:hypothetical protein [Pseudomonas sp. TMW22080]HBP46845.1 hypothetical protein [Pseudomonas sp.]